MKIFVYTFDEGMTELYVDSSDTILFAKNKLGQLYPNQYPNPSILKWMSCGKLLDNGKTLSECCLKDRSAIHQFKKDNNIFLGIL